MARFSTLLAIALIFGLLAGCLGPRRDSYESSREVLLPADSPEADRIWEASQVVLREHRFRLDRLDRPAGIVSTFPVASQQFFEFWRRDVGTRPDLVESSLNPLRRWVEIQLSNGESGEWREISVKVYKQRISAPDRQFNNSAAAYQFFNDTLPTTSGIAPGGGLGEVWLDMGRDPAMEERLLSQILERAGLAAPGEAGIKGAKAPGDAGLKGAKAPGVARAAEQNPERSSAGISDGA